MIKINTGKTIVILGAGIGGIVSANLIRKKLKKKHRIILIDKEQEHIFPPSYLWVLMGWRKIDQIKKSLERLNRKGIEFIQAEVKLIDPEKQEIVLTSGVEPLVYDYLVIALGAELDLTSLSFDSEDIYQFYSATGLVPLKKRLKTFKQGVITLVISSLPYKCPAAPYEAVLFLRRYYQKTNYNDQVTINLYAPEPAPLPVAGTEVGMYVTQMLKEQNINYYPSKHLEKIIPEQKTLLFQDDHSHNYDLLLVVPPHKAPKVVKDAGMLNDSGWITSDRSTLQTQFQNIFAIGDINSVQLPNGGILPKAGVFAHGQAEVIAKNISSEIKGQPLKAKYEGDGSCFIELGNGKAGYASGNFYAMPHPKVKIYKPRRYWHWVKILFEKYWFWKWF